MEWNLQHILRSDCGVLIGWIVPKMKTQPPSKFAQFHRSGCLNSEWNGESRHQKHTLHERFWKSQERGVLQLEEEVGEAKGVLKIPRGKKRRTRGRLGMLREVSGDLSGVETETCFSHVTLRRRRDGLGRRGHESSATARKTSSQTG